MKTVHSAERFTGMGAARYEAVLFGDLWIQVSGLSRARYLGREHGEEHYEIDVANTAITAHFYCSNSGRERVTASNGMEWKSFEEADRWASGETTPNTCPHCGRPL